MGDRPSAELPSQLDLAEMDEAMAAPLPLEREIDATFFSHKHRRSTQLIGNQAGEAIKGRREWLEYDLAEAVYVTSIRVAATGYDDQHEMELSFIDSLIGEHKFLRSSFDGSGFSFEPKAFVRGFGLRPDLSWSLLKSQYISRVDVKGLEQRSFFEVVLMFENVARERAKIESFLSDYLERARKSNEQITQNDVKISEQSSTIEVQENQLQELSNRISDLVADRDEINKRIENGISIEKERNERVKSIELNIRMLDADRSTLVDQIAKSNVELKKLKDEINLFPTEIAGYVSQGTNNIRLYTWLSILPAALIALITYKLFENAERLLDSDTSKNLFDFVRFMISRLPYVVVSAAVLAVCYSLLRGLVSEIVNINRKRQELFKVVIIARDISYASQHGLDLSADQAYDLRTQTKMELIKEHLKVNIGDEFTYSPAKPYLTKLKSLALETKRDGDDEGDNQSLKAV